MFERDPNQLDPEKFKFLEEELPIKLRLHSMIAAREEAKQDFRYLSSPGVRTIMAKFIKNSDMLEDLVNLVDD